MYIFFESNNSLQHHGVKGMKWGVRKKQTPSIRKSAKKQAENDKKKLQLTDKQKKAIKIAAAVTPIRLDDLDINTDNIHSVVTNVSQSARQNAEKFNTFVEKGKDFVMHY